MLVVMSFLMLILSAPQPIFQMLNGLHDTGDVTLSLSAAQVKDIKRDSSNLFKMCFR